MNFLYIKIPVARHAPRQAHQLADQLDQILKQHGLGSVAGWGNSLGDALPDGSRPIAFTRIDVDVSDLPLAVALLQANLASLGAPTGTQIHYTVDQHHRKSTYSDSSWSSE
ncbi:MAG: hypothetical protein JWR40_1137 [Massilia sp.]|jgi:hypothetical protein|nr:hypothetical protein [Massilia sp.]